MLNRNAVLVSLALAVGTATALWLVFKPSRASAKRRSIAQEDLPQSLLLIGDSQTKRFLGDAYVNAFSELDVSFFGKSGVTHEDYLEDSDLIDKLSKLGCADIVVVQLGDNGVPNRSKMVRDFAETIRDKCPNALLIWGGPMKAVRPTIESNYVNVTNTSSPRYLPTYNAMRNTWDSRLAAWLADTAFYYVSNFYLQEEQPQTSDFSDSRGGDGVHLTESSANAQAHLMKDYIYNTLIYGV